MNKPGGAVVFVFMAMTVLCMFYARRWFNNGLFTELNYYRIKTEQQFRFTDGLLRIILVQCKNSFDTWWQLTEKNELSDLINPWPVGYQYQASIRITRYEAGLKIYVALLHESDVVQALSAVVFKKNDAVWVEQWSYAL